MSTQKYRVFKRRPWRRTPRGWEAYGGARKTTVENNLTLDEARRCCAEGNKNAVRG